MRPARKASNGLLSAGLELLPDGTFVTTTYGVLKTGEKPLVVIVHFKLQDIDAKAALRPKKHLQNKLMRNNVLAKYLLIWYNFLYINYPGKYYLEGTTWPPGQINGYGL
ncbi:MAG: hypothetical protein ACYSWZ_06530 [Planctomycetota bacterium]